MIGKNVSTYGVDVTDFVKDWFKQLDRGIKRRRKEEKRWDKNEKYENMHQWDDELGVGNEVTVNKLGAYIRNYRAQVAYNEPRCKLTPKTSDLWKPIQVPVAGPGGRPELDEMGQVVVREVIPAKAREALINDSILAPPKQCLQQTSGLLTRSGIIAQGYLKTGYNPIFSTAPTPKADQKIPIKDKMLDLSQFVKNKFNGAVVEGEPGRLVTRDQIPVWEDFFIKWVPYRNMIIDPDGGNYWDDHRWVCEEEIMVVQDVKDDPLFKNTKDLRPSGKRIDDPETAIDYNAEGSDWSSADDSEDNDPGDVVRIFHIYDMINEEYIVLADGHGKELRRVPWTELKISDHPYADFRPTQITGEFYQRPIATDLYPINEWYNISRKFELIAMMGSPRKLIVRKGAINQDGMDALTNDEDLAVVFIDIPKGQPLSAEFEVFNPSPINSDTYRNTGIIGGDFAEVGGMTDEARGKASADTATQVNAMEQYSGSRISHDRKILAETWRLAFKKLNDSVDANMTKERAIMVQGTDGQVFNSLVDPDMIAGDFDVSVDFQEMAENNTAMQAAGRIQMLQAAGQAPWMFAEEHLVKGWLEPYGLDKDQNFVDAMVKSAQMQMQMMQAAAQPEGQVPEAGAPENEADAISQSAAGGQAPRMSSAT